MGGCLELCLSSLWQYLNIGLDLQPGVLHSDFRVGVHFDGDEALGHPANDGNDVWSAIENAIGPASTVGEGIGHSGFWLAYWQNTC